MNTHLTLKHGSKPPRVDTPDLQTFPVWAHASCMHMHTVEYSCRCPPCAGARKALDLEGGDAHDEPTSGLSSGLQKASPSVT
eukprot:scaffold21069_cov58-Phaeocystis_antarctica.AAC.2